MKRPWEWNKAQTARAPNLAQRANVTKVAALAPVGGKTKRRFIVSREKAVGALFTIPASIVFGVEEQSVALQRFFWGGGCPNTLLVFQSGSIVLAWQWAKPLLNIAYPINGSRSHFLTREA